MSSQNVKDEVISFIKRLPDDSTLEDIMYHLYVREKIFRGVEEADKGNKVTNEEAKKIMEQWFE